MWKGEALSWRKHNNSISEVPVKASIFSHGKDYAKIIPRKHYDSSPLSTNTLLGKKSTAVVTCVLNTKTMTNEKKNWFDVEHIQRLASSNQMTADELSF